LLAAEGWIELGNYFEAHKELEHISTQMRRHPDVLEVRWDILERAKNWKACLEVALCLVELAPERCAGWIHRSYSLHVLKRTQEAFDNLLPVAERFPDNWVIPYNLACYSAQLGRMDEARRHFNHAILIDFKAARRASVGDADLRPLWEKIGARDPKEPGGAACYTPKSPSALNFPKLPCLGSRSGGTPR